jgi:hypothetical protein
VGNGYADWQLDFNMNVPFGRLGANATVGRPTQPTRNRSRAGLACSVGRAHAHFAAGGRWRTTPAGSRSRGTVAHAVGRYSCHGCDVSGCVVTALCVVSQQRAGITRSPPSSSFRPRRLRLRTFPRAAMHRHGHTSGTCARSCGGGVSGGASGGAVLHLAGRMLDLVCRMLHGSVLCFVAARV